MSEEKFALVTGSSSGLGREICNYLLDEGYVVFGLSKRGSDIEHGKYVDIMADIRDELAVEDAFEIVAENTPALDLIVNNAGICMMSPMHETSSKEFSDHLNTNILGHFHVLKHSVDFLADGRTHVITISSVAAQQGLPEMSAYCASKAGLMGLIQSCREEWKKWGVRFSTMVPGAIDTPLWERLGEGFPKDKMMLSEDFIQVFDMLVKSPAHVQFPTLNFIHKDGIIN